MLSACGEQVDPSSSEPTPSGVVMTDTSAEPEPTPTSATQLPLNEAALEDNMGKLSDADRALANHYLNGVKGEGLSEGTWILAAPITVDEAITRLFGPDPRPPTEADEQALMSGTASGYAVMQVGNGVVAFEDTGFADPPRRLLAALSRDGVVSAVGTGNIEAMVRFGYARDGEVVFDGFEYAFVDNLDKIPAEVRDLAALAWQDLDGPMVATADWFSVAMAMGEKVTGVRAAAAVQRAPARYPVPLPWGATEDD